MAGNTIGTLYRLTTFGESHGPGIGGVIDGCPAGLRLDPERIAQEMSRRRPGQSKLTTARNEPDEVEFLSGIADNVTMGTPIAFLVRNLDARPADYAAMKDAFRPSHADFTYQAKYGLRAASGSGRSSARETLARVVAGAVAQQLLEAFGVTVTAFVSQVADIRMEQEQQSYTRFQVDSTAVRCPHPESAARMTKVIEQVKEDGDTCGGVITCCVNGLPAGIGEPVFEKLSASLAGACMSINAAHGFEFGSGFEGATMRGSVHNDPFVAAADGTIRTATNRSGGIQGGISNGMELRLRVAFKPVSTLMREQQTVDSAGKTVTLKAEGRHDPCVVPRAVPIVEAMVAITLADQLLRNAVVRLDTLKNSYNRI
jgi:chorismate synthase